MHAERTADALAYATTKGHCVDLNLGGSVYQFDKIEQVMIPHCVKKISGKRVNDHLGDPVCKSISAYASMFSVLGYLHPASQFARSDGLRVQLQFLPDSVLSVATYEVDGPVHAQTSASRA